MQELKGVNRDCFKDCFEDLSFDREFERASKPAGFVVFLQCRIGHFSIQVSGEELLFSQPRA